MAEPTRVPFRLKILMNLTELLRTINPDNGYEFDMRKPIDPENPNAPDVIQRGKILFGEDDPVPMIALIEPPVPAEGMATPQKDNPAHIGKWDILIQGFVKDDPSNPSDDAYRLMAEVKKVWTKHVKDSETLDKRYHDYLGLGQKGKPGNRINGVTMGRGAVRPADSVSDKSFFWLHFTLDLSEDLANPYVY